MRRTIALLASLGLLGALGLGVAGCENYAETVGCTMGLVLDESDRCVAPPAPDGGTTVATCEALCEVVPTWSAERLSCLEDQLGMFGAVPEACRNPTTTADCLTCVTEAGATDRACATLPTLCP
jgi:hypothetical protein